jgi:hypothetical protein
MHHERLDKVFGAFQWDSLLSFEYIGTNRSTTPTLNLMYDYDLITTGGASWRPT